MSLFNDLGRKVEELKQEVSDGASDDGPYRCEACDERFAERHDQCPECGSDAVVAVAGDYSNN